MLPFLVVEFGLYRDLYRGRHFLPCRPAGHIGGSTCTFSSPCMFYTGIFYSGATSFTTIHGFTNTWIHQSTIHQHLVSLTLGFTNPWIQQPFGSPTLDPTTLGFTNPWIQQPFGSPTLDPTTLGFTNSPPPEGLGR